MTERTNQIAEEATNKIYISGTITSPFKYNNECLGEKFYQFNLKTKRRSGVEDEIKVIISERLLYFCDKKEGDRIAIEGQLRTHNSEKGLDIYAFVKDIYEPGENDVNEVMLIGYICKEVTFRETPFGRKISDLILAVNRRYNRSDYIPCISWGRSAKFVSTLPVGTQLKIKGRLQSREYLKRYGDGKEETKTVNELSISRYKVM